MRRLLAFTLGPVLGLAALASAAAAASGVLLINESPSLPQGLYWRTAAAAPGLGDIVALEPPRAARRYLTGLGMPPTVKLLKRVAAVQGQQVCARSSAVRVGDEVIPVRRRDRRGLPLPRQVGCRALDEDEIFVLGDTDGSFDSRYFGPVRGTAVAGIYREVLTW